MLTRWSLLAVGGAVHDRASVEREEYAPPTTNAQRAAFRYTYTPFVPDAFHAKQRTRHEAAYGYECIGELCPCRDEHAPGSQADINARWARGECDAHGNPR